jgi:transposase-like protein
MAYEVSVAENIEWLEVCAEEDLDQPRLDPMVVETQLKNQMRQQMKEMLETALEWERDEQVQALRYERGVIGRQDYRNGYRARSLSTTLGSVDLRVPRARKPLSFGVFEAYQRRWGELDGLLLEAYLGGMSCRAVGERLAPLLGRGWSGATIAKLSERLVQKLKEFKHQRLADHYVALVLDGMYLRIRQCGEKKRPVVAVLGVGAEGRVDLLALRVCYSENSTEVEGLLRSVKDRGLHGLNLQLVTLDGDKGLESAVLAVYGNVRIQDCRFHRLNRLHRNARGKKRARGMMQEASLAFKQPDRRAQRRQLRQFCDRWREKEPEAIARFEYRLERCFEVNALPPHLRSRLATTNLCEGLFRQIRQRTNRIGAFETPQAVELFVYAIVCQKTWIHIPGRRPAAPLLDPFTHSS